MTVVKFLRSQKLHKGFRVGVPKLHIVQGSTVLLSFTGIITTIFWGAQRVRWPSMGSLWTRVVQHRGHCPHVATERLKCSWSQSRCACSAEYAPEFKDSVHSMGDIVNNVVITMCGVRWFLDLLG